MTEPKVHRKQIRWQGEGVNVAADVNVVVGDGTAGVSSRQTSRIVQRSTSRRRVPEPDSDEAPRSES